MQSSLLDRIFPSSSPLLPQHDRRSSISPTSTTTSPAANTSHVARTSNSAILRPAPVFTTPSHHFDPLLPIDRASKSLQSTIQSLLDAQSERLLAGLTSSNESDELSSNGSLTPTPTMSSTTIPHKPATIPIRQPPQKMLSLRGARRGLSRSMREFAALKQEEGSVLGTQMQDREDALKRVEDFVAKRQGILSEMASISSESGAQSAGRLRAEANDLDARIRELENRLLELKVRQRILLDEAQQVENALQSRLSSYSASLELLDKDIRKFLTRPPIAPPKSGVTTRPTDANGATESFYALHPKRRTLEMATEHWRMEQADLKRRRESIERERMALVDGRRVWRDVVTEIHMFEEDLKAQMQKLSLESISQQDREEGMLAVLGRMASVMEYLERQLQEAEEKDWNLLICCIGAELEAFRQGRQILIEASGLQDTQVQQEGERNALLGDNDGDDAAAAATATSARAPKTLNHALLSHPGANTTMDYALGRSIVPSYPAPTAERRERSRSPRSTGREHNLLLADPAPTEAGPRKDSAIDSRSESDDDDPGSDFLVSHD